MDSNFHQNLSLHKFQALSQAFDGVVYELHHPGGKLDWSDQCSRLFGFSRDEMGSDLQSWAARIHPQDRGDALQAMYRILRSDQPVRIEYRVCHRQGHYLWVRDYSYICGRGADGSCHIIGFLQNIDESRQRQKDLELARRAIDSSINGIAFTDMGGLLTYVNQSFIDLVGYQHPEELLGRQVGSLWKNPKKARVVLRSLQKFGDWSGEVAAVRPDGQPAYFEVSAHVVENPEGEAHCYMASFVDVTEHKQAVQEVLESEEKYRLLFSSSSDAIVIFESASYRILDVNRAALDLYGYTREEFLSLDMLDLGEEIEQSRFRMQQVISGDLRHFPQVRHRRKNGDALDIEVSIGCFNWKKHRVFAAFLRDVSDRNRIEQLKDDMLSAVSHEMRTPLTAILGFTDYLLKSEEVLAGQKDFLQIIHQQSERLKDLVENHLNLQRLRAGCGVGSIHPVEVFPLLHGAVSMFSSDRGRDRIHIQCNQALPAVRGDENQLYRALYNLLSNAIKYSLDNEAIVVGAYGEVDGVVLYVKDQGVGIPAEHQESIFDRFFRVPSDYHTMRGTGLGLSLVREIVKAHNGRVWLESKPGCGSCFYMKLPLYR
ncbi:sensor histidine kinase [Syntrophotalea acetylenica]|uniref:histidine kinase n=1 Tax=Syntrophotalea acetylenica TaxID=29542 RepID=A0A1L3GCF7_SYNAC|nr:PAS domain S-box protein [Syntrophotalea acetylenica]APG23626.1 hypothetical protein A7E75_00265 [Syntrophotalea acetylenica]APG44203.1 hypothetical protein A6070_08870 [Syntrophotalea acetylenica]